MLRSIFDTLKSIGDFFKSLFDIVMTLIKDIIDFIAQLLKLPAWFNDTFSQPILPPIMLTAILGIVALLILLRVLGRSS